VFVSTFDSKVFLFQYSYNETSLMLEDSWKDQDTLNGSQKLCESVAVLRKDGKNVLVCAMRDGTLLSSQIHVEHGGKFE